MKRAALSALGLLVAAMPLAAQAGGSAASREAEATAMARHVEVMRMAAPDAMMMNDGPGNMMYMRHEMPGAASMLLSHTGELKLTDQQVVRLAAIARRAQDRHEAMHQGMMQEHGNMPAGQPSADMMRRMQTEMEQMHEQERADLRDALAVLTPDQLATAFEMAHGDGGPGMMMSPSMQTRTIRIERPDGPMRVRADAPRPPS
jgi:hypothetical protein